MNARILRSLGAVFIFSIIVHISFISGAGAFYERSDGSLRPPQSTDAVRDKSKMIFFAENSYASLTGTVMQIESRWLNVKSEKDESIFTFRIGRKTAYIPHRYPYPGERVRVEYLYHRGVAVAYSIALLGSSTERETNLPPGRSSVTASPQTPLPEKPSVSDPFSSSSPRNIMTVVGTSANVRSGAGNEFSTVCTVKQEDELLLLGEHGEWLNVRLKNGQEGWINNKFVR